MSHLIIDWFFSYVIFFCLLTEIQDSFWNIVWWWFSCSVASNSCDLMNCSPPDASVHDFFREKILKWVAISFSSGSSWPRNEPTSPALLSHQGHIIKHGLLVHLDPCVYSCQLFKVVEFGPKWFHCLNALFWVAKIKLDWNYLGQMIQWTSRKPKAYWLFCIEKKPLESDSLRKILLWNIWLGKQNFETFSLTH